MSKPFFIWTMRRTGGTSLTVLLETISEYQEIQHEPFNGDRVFGSIIQKFHKGKEITQDLDMILNDTPLIKHCYEIFDREFNDLIINASIKQNYKHIFLIREDEVSRIMSLFLAQQTNVWGHRSAQKYELIITGQESLFPFDIDKLIAQYELDQKRTNEIKEMLAVKHKQYNVVSFEDIYTGSRKKRLKNLQELFNFLEFNKNTMHEFKDEIEKWIFNSSQNSKSILEYVPNYKEAEKALSNISNTSKSNTLSTFRSFIKKIIKKRQ